MADGKIVIYGRNVWNAREPRSRVEIPTPTPKLVLHHSAGAEDAGDNGLWADDVKGIQNFHMDGRGWDDIAYNLLADQSGQKWMGRGPGIRGAHVSGLNSEATGLCAIGNFEIHQPTAELLEALANIVAHGLLESWWATAITGPHSDFAATACCGRFLAREIPNINQRAADLIAALSEPPPPPVTIEDRVTDLEVRVTRLEDD